MAQTSKNAGVSAKDYAKEQLGNLDLSYLDKERNVAQNTYNTSLSSLENNFNNLMNQINSNRADTRKNFNTGRATIAENAYDTNRANALDLSSRVAGNTGLQSLGEVGNRIETGRQYSDLANQFYKDMNELDTTQKQSESQYDTDKASLKNTLDQTLAGIDSRAADIQNNYNLTLGQLAEAVQSRWDNNENAEAELAQAKAAAAQAHADAVNASKANLQAAKRAELNAILSMKDKDGNPVDADTMASRIATSFEVDRSFAENVLRELGVMPTKSFSFSANETYDPSLNYLKELVGGW